MVSKIESHQWYTKLKRFKNRKNIINYVARLFFKVFFSPKYIKITYFLFFKT